MKLLAWLIIAFACACASDCGAPAWIVGIISCAWIFGSIAILEHIHRKEVQEQQRRLNKCRAQVREKER